MVLSVVLYPAKDPRLERDANSQRPVFSGAGVGKVTLTATALVSSALFVPHGTSQAIEVHPKLS